MEIDLDLPDGANIFCAFRNGIYIDFIFQRTDSRLGYIVLALEYSESNTDANDFIIIDDEKASDLLPK